MKMNDGWVRRSGMLRMHNEGFSRAEIAKAYDASPHTVSTVLETQRKREKAFGDLGKEISCRTLNAIYGEATPANAVRMTADDVMRFIDKTSDAEMKDMPGLGPKGRKELRQWRRLKLEERACSPNFYGL